jgi:hypothetical protein
MTRFRLRRRGQSTLTSLASTEVPPPSAPSAANQAPFIPRRERLRRHHAEMLATARRDGVWWPTEER